MAKVPARLVLQKLSLYFPRGKGWRCTVLYRGSQTQVFTHMHTYTLYTTHIQHTYARHHIVAHFKLAEN